MRKILVLTLTLSLLLVPILASGASYHSIPNGYSLYSMTFKSVNADNGICYQGAQTSIMSYARTRQTMHTPQSHDLADLYALRNS